MAQAELKKTLNLTGVTVNAMALIAPGAFLWLTYQMQAAQVDTAGHTTAGDMFAGLVLALIMAFLTAVSYAMLAEKYPEAGTGSSYYFAEQAFLKENSSHLHKFSRFAKFVIGWASHLYYWVYPGVMVAMMATLISYIASQYGANLSPLTQVIVAAVFAFVTGYVAYRGINGSTMTSILINVIQIVTLVGITIMALIYRLGNPQHVHFLHRSLTGVMLPHNLSAVLFQSTIAILLLVGFESATALAAESQSIKHVSRGVILSLVIQGLIFYLFEYFGADAWINSGYKIGKLTGYAAAAQSSAPIGDMVRILGNVFFSGAGFTLMILVAISVAIAVFGTTLACMNTGVRVTYAMGADQEVPSFLGVLHPKFATPHKGVWTITIASAVIGAFGVLSVTNLTAITLMSNIGTFLLYGLTNLVALVAFTKQTTTSPVRHILVPVLGFLANIGMLLAVLYLGILGGGATKTAALEAIVVSGFWGVLGLIYLLSNSKARGRQIIGVPVR